MGFASQETRNIPKMPYFKKNCLLLILMALVFIPLEAQHKNYSPGYIITLEGDTLDGWVKDRNSGTFTTLYPRIRFRNGDSPFRRKYSPEQIRGYACNNQFYESIPLYEESAFFTFRYHVHESHKPVFLRIICRDGPLSYYHWEYVDEDSDYLDHIPLFYLDGRDQMVRVSQGILGLKRKRLMEYFYHCPEMVYALERKALTEIDQVYEFYLDHCIDP
jgi:hypothetical protein